MTDYAAVIFKIKTTFHVLIIPILKVCNGGTWFFILIYMLNTFNLLGFVSFKSLLATADFFHSRTSFDEWLDDSVPAEKKLLFKNKNFLSKISIAIIWIIFNIVMITKKNAHKSHIIIIKYTMIFRSKWFSYNQDFMLAWYLNV